MKRTIILIIVSLVSGALFIFVLYILSNELNHKRNDFVRLFPPHLSDPVGYLDIEYNSYYIAGTASNHIYLGNSTAPLHLLVVDTSLTDTVHVNLKIDNPEDFKFKAIRVKVDSPYFYITDGIVPAIFKGTVNTWEATRNIRKPAYFTDAIPVTNSSFVLKTVSESHENIIAKQGTKPPYLKFANSVLEKQVDGLFCTDGMLHFAPSLDYLVYLYHYRNEFICMDTSLNVLYKGNTIDTVSRAQIKVAKIESKNEVTLAAPPLMVNKQSSVFNEWLFVNSNMLSKNENVEVFSAVPVIDVYNLKDGKYQFSFYLFGTNKEGAKMHGFKVFNNMIVALFGKNLITYDLKTKYFRNPQDTSG